MILTPQQQFLRYCILGNYEQLLEFYIANSNQINVSDNNEEAFWWSCGNGFLQIAKWLLSVNPSINVSANHEQAFRVACASGSLHVLKWLFEQKPNIDVSVFDERAFTNACFSGKIEVVQWLISIKPKIDITAENHYGICVAAQYNHYCIVNYLLDLYCSKGLDLNAIPREGIQRPWLLFPRNASQQIECAICYETINTYHQTPCNHTYCKSCIYTWTTMHNNCPYCRSVL